MSRSGTLLQWSGYHRIICRVRVDGKRSYALTQRHFVSSPLRRAALLRRLRFSASRTAELGEVDEDEEEDCRLKKSAPWTLLPGVLAGGAAF